MAVRYLQKKVFLLDYEKICVVTVESSRGPRHQILA